MKKLFGISAIALAAFLGACEKKAEETKDTAAASVHEDAAAPAADVKTEEAAPAEAAPAHEEHKAEEHKADAMSDHGAAPAAEHAPAEADHTAPAHEEHKAEEAAAPVAAPSEEHKAE